MTVVDLGDRVGTALTTALLVASPMVSSESLDQFAGNALLITLWLATWCIWGFTTVFAAQRRVWVSGPTLVLLALVGWMSVNTLILLWAEEGDLRLAVHGMWNWVGLAAVFFLCGQYFVTDRQRRAICAVMVGVAVALAAHACFQSVYELPLARAEYALDPTAALLKAGVDAPPGSPERALYEFRLASPDSTATFALANSLAGFLTPWMILLCGMLVLPSTTSQVRTSGARETARRLVCAALCCLLGLGIALTHSRSALVAVGCGMLGMACRFWYERRPHAWKAWCAGTVGLSVLFLGVSLAVLPSGLIANAAKSLRYRLEYWQATVQLIADHPWRGCGLGQFQDYYARYQLPAASETVADPHHFLLEVWATAGTPGGLLVLGFLGSWWWHLRRRAGPTVGHDQPDHDRLEWWIYGGALVGLAIALLAGFLTGFVPHLFLFIGGAPLGAFCVCALRSWVREGQLPWYLPAIAAGALLVHLMTAGGIAFPGVAGSLWLLMVLSIAIAAPLPPRWCGLSGSVVVALAALFLALACRQTALQPSIHTATMLQSADRLGQRSWEERLAGRVESSDRMRAAAMDQYRAAVEQSPFDAAPWWHQAWLAQTYWLGTQDEADRLQFRQFLRGALRRQPHSATAHLQVGLQYLRMYRSSNDARDLQAALDAWSRAVQCQPNRASLHANLAWAQHLAGQASAAADSAQHALDLDDQHEHQERKLSRLTLADPGVEQRWDGVQAPGPEEKSAEALMESIARGGDQ